MSKAVEQVLSRLDAARQAGEALSGEKPSGSKWFWDSDSDKPDKPDRETVERERACDDERASAADRRDAWAARAERLYREGKVMAGMAAENEYLRWSYRADP